MIGVILAAGDGKRLKKSSNEDCCKPLTKINEKSLIIYALDNLVRLKIPEAYIVVGKEGTLIRNVVGNEYNNVKLHYVCQQEQKGLMNAFMQALKVIDDKETVVLQLSDEIFVDLKTEGINNAVETGEYDFYCGITYEKNPQKIKNNFSVETNSESLLVKCIEKPQVVVNNIKGTGFSVFNGKAQKLIKETCEASPDKLCDLCDSFNYLTETGLRGTTILVAEREFNINTLSDLTEAESVLKN